MTWEPGRRLLTVAEAADSAGVEPSTIRAWLARGRLSVCATRNGQALILESHLLEVEARDARRRARRRGDIFGPIA